MIQAYLTICDQMIVFSPHMAEQNPLLGPLVFHVEPKLTSHLNEFLMNTVFVEDDDGKHSFNTLKMVLTKYSFISRL